jgi:hypothetical protein
MDDPQCTHGLTLGAGFFERCAECGRPMQPLVARLNSNWHTIQEAFRDMREAADRIVALEAERDRLAAEKELLRKDPLIPVRAALGAVEIKASDRTYTGLDVHLFSLRAIEATLGWWEKFRAAGSTGSSST